MIRKVLCLLALCGAMMLQAEDFSKELAEVKTGQRTEAKASWWGFDKENATKCLQAAINSGVKKLVIDNTGSDWILDPVELVDNQEIVLAENVILTARKGGYKDIRDAMISGYARKNIIIRGEPGAMIRMHKADYQNEKEYKHSEWRHTIALWACEDVVIRDLNIKSSGGDGIYLGANWITNLHGKISTRKVDHRDGIGACVNVLIENVICDDHHRQGISVISAKNLIIRKCVLKNTKGTAPMAGIDFEPNRAKEVLENCIMEDCVVENNAGGGILVATEIDTPIDLKIRRCKIIGGSRGLSCTPPTDRGRTNPGKIEVTDCEIRDTENSGIVVGNHLATFYEIVIKDSTLINSGTMPGLTPISFTYLRPKAGMVGNVKFENVTVKAIPGRRLLAFKSWAPNTFLGKITGVITVDGKAMDVAEYIKEYGLDQPMNNKPGQVDFNTLKPVSSKTVEKARTLRLRQAFNLLIWADAGQEIKFKLEGRDTKRRMREIKLPLIAPDGKTTELGVMAPGETKEFSFTAETAGLYRLPMNIDLHMALFVPAPGVKWSVCGNSEKGYVNMFKPANKTRLYFAVPDGLREFKLEVTGYPGETVTAEILDAAGKVVDTRQDFDGPEVFELKRESTGAEIWSIRLSDAVEDVEVRLLTPLSPVFATHPDNLLRVAQ